MGAARRLWRRLRGHNGVLPVIPPAPAVILPHVQAHKRVTAERKVEESRAAVDAFTASLDAAMRGRQHRPRTGP